MNVPLIEVSQKEALTKLEDFKYLNTRQRTREDERLQVLYKAVSKGARVINIKNAFSFAGLNEKGQPKLAIARADWKRVYFHPKREMIVGDTWLDNRFATGAGAFTDTPRFNERAYSKTISVPRHTFSDDLAGKLIHSRVPYIPPQIRPSIDLRNFHILFEVDNWDEYPVDPYLLRRIDNYLFVVIAEWELTPLEASLLGSMVT